MSAINRSRVPEPNCVTADFYRDGHQRLLGGDQEIRDQLAAALLRDVRVLVRPGWQADPAAIGQALDDAILDFLNSPQAFDPTRGSLPNYVMAGATRNLIDQFRRESRRARLEAEAAREAPRVTDSPEPKTDQAGQLEAFIVRCGQTHGAFARAWLNGASMGELAAMVGLADRPVVEQRTEVRRLTERLRQRFKRWVKKAL